MKKIYILLTKSDTIVSRIIHLITADSYTHVSISFEEGLQPLYSSSRKNGRTMFPAGPCMEYFWGGYYERHPFIPCALYELQVKDEVYFLAKQEAQRIMNRSEKCHYNIIGLILCQLNIPFHRRWHFFCSQFVGEILYRSDALPLPKDTSLMRPSDYMEIPQLSCRFRGTMQSLLAIQYQKCCG